MTHSLYTKFVLGYLLFGLLGFVLIATFSSHMTHEYLVRERSDAMYDEANLLASTYSDIYQGKTISLDTANPQLEAVSTYLGASAWVLDHKGAVVAETSPASHSGKTIEGFDPTVTGNKSYIIGDFFGMFPGETLSVLAPITGNFNTYGYVVLHMPVERILDSQNQILNIGHYLLPVPDHPFSIHQNCVFSFEKDHRWSHGIRRRQSGPHHKSKDQ